MADIQLRFGKDMLTVSSPVRTQLADVADYEDDDIADAPEEAHPDIVAHDERALRLSQVREVPSDESAVQQTQDLELALLLEPEVFEEAYTLEKVAGAQCLVAPTANLTPARLAHVRMQDAAADLARSALQVVSAHAPEHVLVEIAPCGLPLDAASKASLLESRMQYIEAASLFKDAAFDAFFLNGFTSTTDLKCALMGIRKVSDAPIIACVDVDANGMLAPLSPGLHARPATESLEEAVSVMAELGANVAGFSTAAPADVAAELVARVKSVAYIPVMAELCVRERVPGAAPTEENPYPQPDDVFAAAQVLHEAGAQFLRASGDATPAYTGSIAAAVAGMDIAGGTLRSEGATGADAPSEDMDKLASRLRSAVNDHLGIG
ncbi:MAG: methionine synthase [Eggerthellaceae bacterium]|nr:methionine synthase [Eggerthellaceae bacterium]